MSTKPSAILAAALATLSALHCAAADPVAETSVTTVQHVDLERYAGRWYEIARLPNRFQDDCVGNVTAEYSRREDGRIDVINRCATTEGNKAAAGVARIVDPDTRARLKVRFAPAFLSFIPAVWGDYWIIDLASDYSYAVVGDPDRRYLWILARTPDLGEAILGEIMSRVEEQGYDTEDLLFTKQAG